MNRTEVKKTQYLWCRSRVSNPDEACASQDFKSYRTLFQNAIKSALCLIGRGFTAVFGVGVHWAKSACFGPSCHLCVTWEIGGAR